MGVENINELDKNNTKELLTGLNEESFKENVDFFMLPYKEHKELKFLTENLKTNESIVKIFNKYIPKNELNLA